DRVVAHRSLGAEPWLEARPRASANRQGVVAAFGRCDRAIVRRGYAEEYAVRESGDLGSCRRRVLCAEAAALSQLLRGVVQRPAEERERLQRGRQRCAAL